jgi:hypothetical protein
MDFQLVRSSYTPVYDIARTNDREQLGVKQKQLPSFYLEKLPEREDTI